MIFDDKTVSCPFGRLMETDKVVMWEITKACNLNCEHCLSRSDLKSNKGLKTDELIEVVKKFSKLQITSVYITGGEPLLRDDIFEVISKIKEFGMEPRLATNATLIDDEIADKIANLNVNVNISIDDFRGKIHDKFRGYDGAFKKTVNGVRKLVNRGVHVRASTMVTRDNFQSLDKMAIFFVWLGVKDVIFSSIYNFGRASERKLEFTDKEHLELSEKLQKMQLEFYPFLNIIFPRFSPLNEDKPLNGCIGGDKIFFVNSLADIYPCTYLEKLDDRFVIGNMLLNDNLNNFKVELSNDSFQRLIDDRLNKSINLCKECNHEKECKRGCPVFGKFYMGEFEELDPLCPKIKSDRIKIS